MQLIAFILIYPFLWFVSILPFKLLYLFSDGYADQFGGAKGKKFMIKSLKELFVEIHKQPMNKQHKHLDKTLLAWAGEREQIDDILIIGFRI